MKPRLPLILFISLISYFSYSQANCVAFDFNSGTAGWEIQPNNTITTNAALWQFKDYGKADDGIYWNDRDSIYSDSKGGAIMMDGDQYANGPIGVTPFVSEIRSPNLNFQGFQGKVFLKFFQYYRNFNSTTRVEVSGNGGVSWDSIYINQEVLQNVETSPGSFKVLDITNFVNIGGENLVRFVLEGEYYFWIIDDVEFCDEDPSPKTFPEYVGDSLQLWGYPYLVDSSDWAIVPNELVVQFKANVTDPERQALRDSLGVIKIDDCVCDRLELWAIGQPGGDTLSPIGNSIGINENEKGSKGSSKIDGVDFNRYNYNELQGGTDTINPPLGPNDVPTGIPSSPADATLIAILDTGVDIHHEELANFIRLNNDPINSSDDDDNCYPDDPVGWNFVDDNNNPDDDHSHGTHVAGIVKNNILKYSNQLGVGCDFRIVPYKTHDYHGVSNLFDVTCATYQAIVDSVSVINDSWGFYGDSSIILSNAVDSVRTHDILIITAAGNDSVNLDTQAQYPACYSDNNIITVAAIDTIPNANSYDTLFCGFSNFSNTCIDIAAPGKKINSTILDNLMGEKTGTSMSAPAVSAVAAIFYCSDYSDFSEIKNNVLSCAKQNTDIDDKVMNGNVIHMDASCFTVNTFNPIGSKNLDLSVFPNPTANMVFIKSKEKMEHIQIQILDITGQSILKQYIKEWQPSEIQEINLANSPSGIYFLNIQYSSYIWSYKIIKI